jgi:hypothetical protein
VEEGNKECARGCALGTLRGMATRGQRGLYRPVVTAAYDKVFVAGPPAARGPRERIEGVIPGMALVSVLRLGATSGSKPAEEFLAAVHAAQREDGGVYTHAMRDFLVLLDRLGRTAEEAGVPVFWR